MTITTITINSDNEISFGKIVYTEGIYSCTINVDGSFKNSTLFLKLPKDRNIDDQDNVDNIE